MRQGPPREHAVEPVAPAVTAQQQDVGVEAPRYPAVAAAEVARWRGVAEAAWQRQVEAARRWQCQAEAVRRRHVEAARRRQAEAARRWQWQAEAVQRRQAEAARRRQALASQRRQGLASLKLVAAAPHSLPLPRPSYEPQPLQRLFVLCASHRVRVASRGEPPVRQGPPREHAVEPVATVATPRQQGVGAEAARQPRALAALTAQQQGVAVEAARNPRAQAAMTAQQQGVGAEAARQPLAVVPAHLPLMAAALRALLHPPLLQH